MAIRYISDLHFRHRNILRYDNRPWTNPEEMLPAMVSLWNQAVADDDLVYILGDVVWSNKAEVWTDILLQLKGQKFIVKGNHDQTKILNQMKDDGIIKGWSQQEIVHDPDSNGDDRYVVLNHSPMPFFVNMHHGNTYHLYGHVHISFDYQCIKHVRRQIEELYCHEVRMYNVGCMIRGMDYSPKTLDEIIQIDKENRKFEERDLEDYITAEKSVGHDKAGMKEKSNI